MAVVAAIGALGPASVGAEVLGYTVEYAGPESVLTCVVLDRGGRPIAYDPGRLIPAQVTRFLSTERNNIIVPAGSAAPSIKARAALLGDLILNTGVLNPGGQPDAPDGAVTDATLGMVVRFAEPVVNRDGDDLVVFEIQRGDSPPAGDVLHVVRVDADEGARGLTVRAFDVSYNDPSAADVLPFARYPFEKPTTETSFHAGPLRDTGTIGEFKALAVGIDLSELGLAEGGAVQELLLQSTGQGTAMVDPVLVAGLPEPVAPNVLAEVPPYGEPVRLLESCLDGVLLHVDQIVFAERVPGSDHWYANFGHYWCGRQEYPEQRLPEGWRPDPIFRRGGRLCLWNLRVRELTVLLDDPEGSVRDPQVHYDGRTILFSYRPGDEPYYHLYEIQVDGTGLRRITNGPFDDIEPAYLPDGRIIFVSSRCNRYVNCWRTPVAVLYSCDADGGRIEPVSSNIEHDNTPWVLPDGRILYMRWEYVDRSQVDFHHLWTIGPDGTDQMVYYGNQHPGIAMLDAKPIPNSRKIVAGFSPAHGRPEHMGFVTVVDPGRGPDDRGSARRVSRTLFRDPFAMSEDCYFVADAQGIWLMDGQGHAELLCSGVGGLQCHEPRPVVPRPRERSLAPRDDPTRDKATLILTDVYHGRTMQGVAQGDIRKLLLLEQLPKPVNFSGGPWPLSIGGTFTLARVLGTVPVEADGSASFEVPAMRSLFFVALDENDLSVKRMQSFVTLQPGETTSCVGCHEARGTTPDGQSLAALSRPPSRIEPIRGVPSVLDFPRDVQPVLDRLCVDCHNPERYEGRVDLTGDHTPLFSQSYWTIVQQALISDGRNAKLGNREPRTIGSSASRLLQLLDGRHYGAKATPVEQKTVRLWIESSAVYAGTYAALGSGMVPVRLPVEAMERRCGACHGHERPAKNPVGQGPYFSFGPTGPPIPLVHSFAELKQLRSSVGYFKFGRDRTPQSLCNISHPVRSLILRAPLAGAEGGLELCGEVVFADVSDPDYLAILSRIREAAAKHSEEKRFGMAGFRPNGHYIERMRAYGILPPDSGGPANVYALDEAYWQSFWYEPTSGR